MGVGRLHVLTRKDTGMQMYDVNSHEHPRYAERERTIQRTLSDRGKTKTLQRHRDDHVRSWNQKRSKAGTRRGFF
jgi:hypothetical protein